MNVPGVVTEDGWLTVELPVTVRTYGDLLKFLEDPEQLELDVDHVIRSEEGVEVQSHPADASELLPEGDVLDFKVFLKHREPGMP